MNRDLKKGIKYLYQHLSIDSDYCINRSIIPVDAQVVIAVGDEPLVAVAAGKMCKDIFIHYKHHPDFYSMESINPYSAYSLGKKDSDLQIRIAISNGASSVKRPKLLLEDFIKNVHTLDDLREKSIIFVVPPHYSLIIKDLSEYGKLKNVHFAVLNMDIDAACSIEDVEIPGRRKQLYHELTLLFTKYYWRNRDHFDHRLRSQMEEAGEYLKNNYSLKLISTGFIRVLPAMLWQILQLRFYALLCHHKVIKIAQKYC